MVWDNLLRYMFTSFCTRHKVAKRSIFTTVPKKDKSNPELVYQPFLNECFVRFKASRRTKQLWMILCRKDLFKNAEQYYLRVVMELDILAKSVKPRNIYRLFSRLWCFVRSSSRTLSVLIISQEKKIYYTFILSENWLSRRSTMVIDTMHINSLFRYANNILGLLFKKLVLRTAQILAATSEIIGMYYPLLTTARQLS